MVAHDGFVEDGEGDGVSFFVIKAKGKFELPDADWSISDFEEAYATIDRFASEIAKLADAVDANALAKALIEKGPFWPTEGPFGLGPAGLLNLPLPENQHSGTDPANPKKEPQTPPDEGE